MLIEDDAFWVTLAVLVGGIGGNPGLQTIRVIQCERHTVDFIRLLVMSSGNKSLIVQKFEDLSALIIFVI